ncbi:hypothetical protein [Chengkuizengella axinellae]|uniref:Uncharacterized protein n=1 Tax=Chengkuizengella axinellae TaxID=3064388 RepID=A0ABT9IWG8_9BACL|nr:hypothetical protein [Chengkuizengella sp. 2205SS18-9]MDP5273691.1 hypothetical protein [Chengkuizengella sp. 2205SS18-9]
MNVMSFEQLNDAIDKISYLFIDTLKVWIDKEKKNLDSFLKSPEDHIDYNPYMIVDYESLSESSELMKEMSESLNIIAEYKKGNPNYIRTQHDVAFENIPYGILERLKEWIEKKIQDMEGFYDQPSSFTMKEYNSFISLDENILGADLASYKDVYEGLDLVIQYKKERII